MEYGKNIMEINYDRKNKTHVRRVIYALGGAGKVSLLLDKSRRAVEKWATGEGGPDKANFDTMLNEAKEELKKGAVL